MKLGEDSDSFRGEIGLAEVDKVLEQTVKHDQLNRKLLFLIMLNTYTERDQCNVAMTGESSVGKTWLATQIANLFPQHKNPKLSDVIKVGYTTSQAFLHDRELAERLETGRSLINCERKMIIWLDLPSSRSIQILRPVMSKDEKEINFKITDKTSTRGYETKSIDFRGYTTFMFLSANPKMDEQEKTRMFQLSPEQDPDKIRESLKLKALHDADPEGFERKLETPERIQLKERISAIKSLHVRYVKIPLTLQITERFIEAHPNLRPRHQRDFERLLSLVKAHALLNVFTRQQDYEIDPVGGPGIDITATEADLNAVMELYETLAESNELGLAPHVYDFYLKTVKAVAEDIGMDGSPIARMEKVRAKYYELNHFPLPESRLKHQFLPDLEASGLIALEQDPNDKRKQIIRLNGHALPPSNLSGEISLVGRGGNEINTIVPPHTHTYSLKDALAATVTVGNIVNEQELRNALEANGWDTEKIEKELEKALKHGKLIIHQETGTPNERIFQVVR